MIKLYDLLSILDDSQLVEVVDFRTRKVFLEPINIYSLIYNSELSKNQYQVFSSIHEREILKVYTYFTEQEVVILQVCI